MPKGIYTEPRALRGFSKSEVATIIAEYTGDYGIIDKLMARFGKTTKQAREGIRQIAYLYGVSRSYVYPDDFEERRRLLRRLSGLERSQVRWILSVYDGKTTTINKILKKTGLNRNRLNNLVRYYGLSVTHIRDWLPVEEYYMLTWMGEKPIQVIAEELGRTESALKNKIKTLKVSFLGGLDYFTANRILGLCNIQDSGYFHKWVQMGLTLIDCSYSWGANSLYLIKQKEFLNFLKKHPEAVDYMSLSVKSKKQLGILQPILTDAGVEYQMAIPYPPKEKLLFCVRCLDQKWVPLYNKGGYCLQCGKADFYYGIDYRGYPEWRYREVPDPFPRVTLEEIKNGRYIHNDGYVAFLLANKNIDLIPILIQDRPLIAAKRVQLTLKGAIDEY